MHAVVVSVSIKDVEAALNQVRENVIPQVQQVPGHVAGYWTRKDHTGLSMVIFESEDVAKAMAEKVPTLVPDGVTVERVEVREVVAQS